MTCKDCIHYCVCKDTVADENWTDEAPTELRAMYSPQGCENFTAAADVAPVKHGEWVKTRYIEVKRCSCCNAPINIFKEVHRYCSTCGAYMDGGKQN